MVHVYFSLLSIGVRRFFEAFGPITRLRSAGACPYYFATDCGTLYAPYCIAELVRHMDRHPECKYCRVVVKKLLLILQSVQH